MEACCSSPDKLRQRIMAAHEHICCLQSRDFPEHMRDAFQKLMQEISKSQQPYFRDEKRRDIARNLLLIYTEAAQLERSLP
jgi:hypothetical protein